MSKLPLDHVVVEALKLVFRKDSEFKAWQDAQPITLSQASAGRASAESTLQSATLLSDEARRNGRGGIPDGEA